MVVPLLGMGETRAVPGKKGHRDTGYRQGGQHCKKVQKIEKTVYSNGKISLVLCKKP